MIGFDGKGKLPMMDILKQRRNTKRLSTEKIHERTLGKSPGSTIDEGISERVSEAMIGINNSCLCSMKLEMDWVRIPYEIIYRF
jgi:hypothetical protein